MDASAKHVVIVGGPEVRDELLAIVLDDGEAVPLFDSIEEAEEFLASTGDFAAGWRAREIHARDLVALLEYQGDEVEYVALSPPHEDLEGGMELHVVPREVLVELLKRQTVVEPPPERQSLWRRLFGR